MKKIIAVFFAIFLCFSLSLGALAGEYTVDGDGNAVYDTAIGYAFHIDDVNGTIEGEDATVINNNISLNNVGSKWAIWFTAKRYADGIYEVITDGTAMGGDIPQITLAEDEIFIAVHSASSRPTEADLYPNWEDKVAALAVKKGDFLVFHSDINVEQGMGSGLMLVLTEDEILAGLIEFPEIDDDPVASIPDEPVSEPENDTDASTPDDAVDTSAEQNEEPDNETAASMDGNTTVIGGNSVEVSEYTIDIGDHEDSSVSVWVWVALAVGAGVIILIVAFFLVPKKK